MSESVKTVLDRALQLSEQERGEVAAHLLASLDAEADTDVDSAWVEEIRQRLDDVRAGRSAPVPWSDARRRIAEDGDDDPR